MNKSFRIFLLTAAAAALFIMASCNNGGSTGSTTAPETAKATAAQDALATAETTEITEAPTEKPAEAPTEAPTTTEVPENWYIDPNGIIPPEVEIVLPANKPGVCIAREEGKTVLQKWTKQGLMEQYEVPEKLAEGYNMNAFLYTQVNGEVDIWVDLTEEPFGPFMYYYRDIDGHHFLFECNSLYDSGEYILLATTDGKAIWYTWGDDFYKMHDFGQDAYVEVDTPTCFFVNKEMWSIDWIEFQNIPL